MPGPQAKRPVSSRLRWRVLNGLERWLNPPMVVLSFIWLLLVFAELVWPQESWIESFGTFIWIVFILEFALRLTLAPDKLAFMRGNWLTAVSLIVPALRMFRFMAALRFAGAAQGFQLIRLVGTVNRTMNALRLSMRRRRFGYIALLTIAVTLLGAAGMLSFEPHATAGGGGGFTGYGDALWWTAMIMTTIGSAYWPVTGPGRVLGFLLSVYAIAVFGYITAMLASFFVGEDAKDETAPIVGPRDIAALRNEIAMLRAELRVARMIPSEPEQTPGARGRPRDGRMSAS